MATDRFRRPPLYFSRLPSWAAEGPRVGGPQILQPSAEFCATHCIGSGCAKSPSDENVLFPSVSCLLDLGQHRPKSWLLPLRSRSQQGLSTHQKASPALVATAEALMSRSYSLMTKNRTEDGARRALHM